MPFTCLCSLICWDMDGLRKVPECPQRVHLGLRVEEPAKDWGVGGAGRRAIPIVLGRQGRSPAMGSQRQTSTLVSEPTPKAAGSSYTLGWSAGVECRRLRRCREGSPEPTGRLAAFHVADATECGSWNVPQPAQVW